MSSSYRAEHIQVLEGIEAVRRRPGMYIGSTGADGLNHLVVELVNNAVDEGIAGHAKNVDVTLHKGNRVTVSDDGRGIPVDLHSKTNKSALETVLTMLHAGGKFSHKVYQVSGGLHGVGLSVVNALAKKMKVTVYRDGFEWTQEYERGVPKTKVEQGRKSERTGTTVVFEPDPQIFTGELEFDRRRLLDYLRHQAFLTPKLRLNLYDERGDEPFGYGFLFETGIGSFFTHLTLNRKLVTEPITFHHEDNGSMVEAVFGYVESPDGNELAFTNNINNPEGGTHLIGFRGGLLKAINDLGHGANLIKEAVGLTADDLRGGLIAIISLRIPEPQFEGQTKAKLGNPEVRSFVEGAVLRSLREYFGKNPAALKAITQRLLVNLEARQAAKSARENVFKKRLSPTLALSGKLADCSNRDVQKRELFIVEGDSAGGCFSGDTKVALLDGRNLSFRELVDETKQGVKHYCYSINNRGEIETGEITNPRITKRNVEAIQVALDNSETIICTPDHRFMLVDGSFKEAQCLSAGNSLMPFYRQLSQKGRRITIEGYELVFDLGLRRWVFTHVLADRYNLRRGVYVEERGPYRHHQNFNKRDNNPNNITRLTKEEHLRLHQQALELTLHHPATKEKTKRLRQSIEFRQKMSALMSTPAMRQMLSKRAKKQWEDPVYKAYMVKKFTEYYQANEIYRKQSQDILREAQARYWSDPEHRQQQAERVRAYFIQHPNARAALIQRSLVQWSNEELRAWRGEQTRQQWTEAFRAQRRATLAQTYFRKTAAALKQCAGADGKIDLDQYDEHRHTTKDKSLLRFETFYQRYFSGDATAAREAIVHYNHRVVSIKPLRGRIDVYDLEVPGTHNFALASGVFVHNSAKQGRDKNIQAVLPLRGKVLNVEKASIEKMFQSQAIKDLIVALGTGVGKDFDLEGLRYGKVIIASDADSDGLHIRTLLLTLFYRYFKPIITEGFVYIAQPPLYKITAGKDIRYAHSDAERDKVLKEVKTKNPDVQRYKGLGEMNPDELWETTLNPEKRVLKYVAIDNAKEAEKLFNILMGSEVEPRRRFIEAHARQVQNLDI